ncbi:MAG TPA: glycosyltransferase [Opitutaceae bacterium]|nr:glycosyltransferase [Opitutaceae bacterium]
MNIRLFYHSILSDWNHGNAHFLRGIVSELQERGHDVRVYEAENNWSLKNLSEQHGDEPVRRLRSLYPRLPSFSYDPADFDVEDVLIDADLVIVHEWNDPKLVEEIGDARRRYPFVLLFHDTHHRMVTAPEEMAAYQLSNYDGVLAYGETLRQRYVAAARVPRAWTWHEAADTRLFRPRPDIEQDADLVWIGNWGDDERSEELNEFLIEPVKALGLRARVHGVRYPDHALALLRDAGIEYRGWLPNFEVPDVFARHRVTVHVPRRPYTRALPGIPTIRPFEALACGIPLVTAPWTDTENLFRPGEDFLVARDGSEMKRALQSLMENPAKRRTLATNGLETIRARHTCAHRVNELLEIYHQLEPSRPREPARVGPAFVRPDVSFA